ncbi:MAG: hypothetical protein IPN63_07960, partial [Gammaproteobacteria bacterium]|nr:hypothetical protein [Gammaproteobacteria bacterium]
MIGAEEGVEYGQGEWELILRFGMISNPPWWPEDTLMMVSWLFEAPTLAMHTDLVLVLNSHGTLASTCRTDAGAAPVVVVHYVIQHLAGAVCHLRA